MSTLTNPRALHVADLPAAVWNRIRDAVSGFVVRWRERTRTQAELRLMSEMNEATRRDLGLNERSLRPTPTKLTRDWTLDHW